jgi:hypothetical protein
MTFGDTPNATTSVDALTMDSAAQMITSWGDEVQTVVAPYANTGLQFVSAVEQAAPPEVAPFVPAIIGGMVGYVVRSKLVDAAIGAAIVWFVLKKGA